MESMHFTLGHLKHVEGADILLAIDEFNHQYESLLKSNIMPGFIVKNFNKNGFDKGYHILETDEDTCTRLSDINKKLYYFFLMKHDAKMTDITSPKSIYPKGYTPHIEFIEDSPSHIPTPGIILKFIGWKVIARIQNFDRN